MTLFCFVSEIILSSVMGDVSVDVEENLTWYSALTTVKPNLTACGSHGEAFTAWWYRIFLGLICTVGVLGNILNLLVLSRHKMMRALDRLERSASHVLLAMACSDLGYCLVQLPTAVLADDFNYEPMSRWWVVYYRMYREHMIDTFMIISAWLIVILSVNRFIVVAQPLRATLLVSGSKTVIGICAVVIFGIITTAPNFLYLKISSCQMPTGEEAVKIGAGLDGVTGTQWRLLQHYRMRVWPILATFLPFAIMTACNIMLIFHLRRAMIARQACSASGNHRLQADLRTKNKIVATLLAVVLMYLIFVVPIEAMLYKNIFNSTWGYIVGKIFNILMALNFASNFLLYVMVNEKFRKIAFQIVCCKFPADNGNVYSTTTKATSLVKRGSLSPARSIAMTKLKVNNHRAVAL